MKKITERCRVLFPDYIGTCGLRALTLPFWDIFLYYSLFHCLCSLCMEILFVGGWTLCNDTLRNYSLLLFFFSNYPFMFIYFHGQLLDLYLQTLYGI